MFWTFEHLNFGFVSNFEIRISDLLPLHLEKIPEELKELFEKTAAGENEMMNDE